MKFAGSDVRPNAHFPNLDKPHKECFALLRWLVLSLTLASKGGFGLDRVVCRMEWVQF